MRPLRMVPMTSLPPFQARLLAARLGAEGIVWQLRGETAIYPFAPIEVLVEEDEVERARALLDVAWAQEADDPLAASAPAGTAVVNPPGGSGRLPSAHTVAAWLLIAVVLLGLALRIGHLG